jgi:hypothetical protein
MLICGQGTRKSPIEKPQKARISAETVTPPELARATSFLNGRNGILQKRASGAKISEVF